MYSEDEVFQPDVGHHPPRIEYRSGGADEQGGLAIGVTLAHHELVTWHQVEVTPQPGEHLVLGEEVVHRPAQLHMTVREDREVVTHPLDIRQQVRRQHDGRLLVSH